MHSRVDIYLLPCHRPLSSSLCWPLLIFASVFFIINGCSGVLIVIVVLCCFGFVGLFAAVILSTTVCFVNTVVSIAVGSRGGIVVVIFVNHNGNRQWLVIDRLVGS